MNSFFVHFARRTPDPLLRRPALPRLFPPGADGRTTRRLRRATLPGRARRGSAASDWEKRVRDGIPRASASADVRACRRSPAPLPVSVRCHDGCVSASTSLRPVTREQWPVVERLWQLYRHDLSEFRGSMPDGEGLYKPGRLPTYFGDRDGCGYLIYSGSALAGFALIRGLSDEPRVMGEFFVVRAVRRKRVGYEAALQLLGLHPGRWEIAFQEENPGAARFWRRVATDAAGRAWREERRPVPGKPEIPPDTWLLLST